jgi:hypothetical protein
MPLERRDPWTSWNWVIGFALAIALGIIAWLQVLENQSNDAQLATLTKARADRYAIDVADADATIAYLKQYTAPGPHPDLPTPEEFSKSLAGGRELIRRSERDWVYRDPLGGAQGFGLGSPIDAQYMPMLEATLKRFPYNNNQHVPPYRPVERVRFIRAFFPWSFFIVWAILLMWALSTARLVSGQRRVVYGQWLIGLCLVMLFVPMLDPLHIVVTQFIWGIIAAIATGALYAICAMIPDKPDTAPRCVTCRYNLTGNVSAICPECGTPIAPTMAGK